MYLKFVLHLQSVSTVFSVGQAVVVLFTARTFEASLRHVPQTYDLTSDFYSQVAPSPYTLLHIVCNHVISTSNERRHGLSSALARTYPSYTISYPLLRLTGVAAWDSRPTMRTASLRILYRWTARALIASIVVERRLLQSAVGLGHSGLRIR